MALLLSLGSTAAGNAAAAQSGHLSAPQLAVNPHQPGPDLPPAGRSLFDYLAADPDSGGYQIPYPFETLLSHIESRTAPHNYFASSTAGVLIPHGRSLQRDAAAPDYYRFPRAVVTVDAEPSADDGHGGMLLKHRLYLGYQEKANLIEVISYNEAAGRFEFQIVDDYRAGGTPTVRYASRQLCTACHQNGAPIFARPLWDETNANRIIAARLREENRAFYGLAVDQSIDVAYAIDNATDRANRFAVTQRVWQDGCGPAVQVPSADCRKNLLAMALQYRLSGQQHFDTASNEYRQQTRPRLAGQWRQHWPEGLGVPNPDVPNRRLLSLDQIEIPAAMEPLKLRAPIANWQFDTGHDQRINDIVAGIGDFIADIDLERIDQHLLANRPTPYSLTAQCHYQPQSGWPQAGQLKVSCRDGDFTLSARLSVTPGAFARGTISQLTIDEDSFVDLPVNEWHIAANGSVELVAGQPYQNLAPRRANGHAVGTLKLAGVAALEAQGTATLFLYDDFVQVHEVLDRMALRAAGNPQGALGDGPLRRSAVIGELFTGLQMPALAWCCTGTDQLPPAVGPEQRLASEQGAAVGPLALFHKHCASCHGTSAKFPPNFLAGDQQQVEARIHQCAERIAYRLAMWSEPGEHRRKTPMPPDSALVRNAINPIDWPGHPDLKALIAYVRLTAAEGRENPGHSDYEDLRPCLATTTAEGGT